MQALPNLLTNPHNAATAVLASREWWKRATEALREYEQAHPLIKRHCETAAVSLKAVRKEQADDAAVLGTKIREGNVVEGDAFFQEVMTRINGRVTRITEATDALIAAYMAPLDLAGFRLEIQNGQPVAVVVPEGNRAQKRRAKALSKKLAKQRDTHR